MMTGDREKELLNAARLLMDARRTSTPLADLPESLRPVSIDEAYFVQDRLALAYGEIGGWKVGAPTPEATPTFAPMPLAWIAPSGSLLRGTAHRYRGLEAEIAFLIGQDLPPRQMPYTRDEVIAAIASCHPAIEVLESGLTDPTQATKLSGAADLSVHGGFVYGPAYPNWRSIDFSTEKATLAVDGVVREERTGSNTSGDLMKLLPWLANEGASRTGGLKAGQWVTTGSWTGVSLATAASVVRVEFSTVGKVGLQFE
jgi:2-keto-4-pentenoate hydratase